MANLSESIERIRRIMRKDKGLSGELDRLPMISWLLFLKMLSKKNDFIISPYKWDDWVGSQESLSGEELIEFIELDYAKRPDGKYGPGLINYLKNIGDESKEALRVSIIFSRVQNRMNNGNLLREVLAVIEDIDLKPRVAEGDTLGSVYETMIREMRDAAGDSGEFYTPRPIVQYIIGKMELSKKQKILDPACGTGGFLIESHKHLSKISKDSNNFSITGKEAKPLPFLICSMNQILHGMNGLSVNYQNTIEAYAKEPGECFDIIMSNPPFGGEEELSIIKENYEKKYQSSETVLLFMAYIMKALKKGGKAAVIIPDRFLFSTKGVSKVIKGELLSKFRVKSIVRLPSGVFAPYTKIATNIMFFEKGGNTRQIKYIEMRERNGKKIKYTKTKPINLLDLRDEFYNSKDVDSEDLNSFNWDININSSLKSEDKRDAESEKTKIGEIKATLREMSLILDELERLDL